MGAFVRLLESGSVAVDSLVTHVIPIEEAERAYQIVTGKLPEPHIGILLSYPTANAQEAVLRPAATIRPVTGQPRIAFVGAGSFAQKFLIPHARAAGSLVCVATSRGITAKSAAEKFGFAGFTSDARETIHRDDVDVVFVATRHDSHAEYAIQALDAGKHVFVEKPLAIVEEDLERLSRSVNDHPGQVLMVGYNRRFSPAAREAAETFHGLSEPLVINYRVNAGLIPMDHWVQGREGGGRILGEVCHFVDLIQFLTQSPPRRVHAVAAASGNAKIPSADNLIISMEMGDGSIASITYVAVGDTSLPKERIEILGGGMSMVINDFRSTERFVRGKRSESKKAGKGYPEEVNAFLAAIRNGGPAPIPLESLFATSLCTFRILDSLTTGLPQEIPPLG
jgi:polar amino acid transport system substrate-binding protein